MNASLSINRAKDILSVFSHADTMLQTARDLTGIGLGVVPIKALSDTTGKRSKAPLSNLITSTRPAYEDSDVLETVLDSAPEGFGIAVVPSPQSRIFVIDADTPEEVSAAESFLSNFFDDDKIPPMTVLSPGQNVPNMEYHHGGGHWWFTTSASWEKKITSKQSVIHVDCDGVTFDIIIQRHLVAVPPTERKEGKYTLNPEMSDFKSIPKAPEKLEEYLIDAILGIREEDLETKDKHDETDPISLEKWKEIAPWSRILTDLGFKISPSKTCHHGDGSCINFQYRNSKSKAGIAHNGCEFGTGAAIFSAKLKKQFASVTSSMIEKDVFCTHLGYDGDYEEFLKDQNISPDIPKVSQLSLLRDWINENLVCLPGASGEVYWGKAGTGVVSLNNETLKRYAKREVFPDTHVPETIVTRAFDDVRASADELREQGISIQPRTRIATDKSENTWIDIMGSERFLTITDKGWEILSEPPEEVHFIRETNSPMEVEKENIKFLNNLHEFFTVDQKDLMLMLASLMVPIIEPHTALPVVLLEGLEGSGKTTSAHRFKRLIDDTPGLSSSMPKDERAMASMAQNELILVYDNVTSIPTEASNLMCRASSGSSYKAVRLYTDNDMLVLNLYVLQIITTVEQLKLRDDLKSRTLKFWCDTPDQYANSAQQQLKFNALLPKFRGAFYSLAAEIKNDINKTSYDTTLRLDGLDRIVQSLEKIGKKHNLPTAGVYEQLLKIMDYGQEDIPEIILYMCENEDITHIKGSPGDINKKIVSYASKQSHKEELSMSGRKFSSVLRNYKWILEDYFDIKESSWKGRTIYELSRFV